MLGRFRDFGQGVVLAPVVRLLLRLGVSPDAVTLAGTLGVVVAALALFPLGLLWQGALVVGCFALSDMVDGQMARVSGRTSRFGAFWDSSLDRVGDAAVLGGLVLWFAGGGDDYLHLCVALWCLVAGSLTSYVRARAESLGMDASGGVAERTERLALVLTSVCVGDLLGLPVVYEAALWLLAVASTGTVVQRVLKVRRQSRTHDVTEGATDGPLPE